MNPAAVTVYCDLMLEIKNRTSVAVAFGRNELNAKFEATTIEVIYLQFRKILEMIALGSLVANKEVYSQARADFAKDWNAELIMKDMGRVNPNFYPVPIIQQPSSTPGVKMDLINRTNDYLTKDDLVVLYKKCGAIMHSSKEPPLNYRMTSFEG